MSSATCVTRTAWSMVGASLREDSSAKNTAARISTRDINYQLANYADCPNVHLRRTFLHPDVQAPGLHSHRSLSVRLPRGPLGGHGQRGGGGGLGPGLPVRSARGTRPVCGPAARQAVGEPGRVPRPVSCPGRPAAGVDIRRLVRAHDNRPGLGCLGPAHQGKRRQRGDLGEGRRVGHVRLRVPRMPHLPGRHSGSQRGGRRAGTALMLYQGRRCRHNLVSSKRRTQLHPSGPDPGILLPPSALVSWVWKANKCHAVCIETSSFHLQEVPEIAQGRAISMLSTRNSEKRLQHIGVSAKAEGWRRRAWAQLEAEQWQHEEEQRRRAEEMERLS